MLKLTTIFFLISGSILAVTHILAMKFFLYWKYEWFDMPMHFLGGVVVGLLLYTLHDIGVNIIPRKPRWFTVLLFVIMVAMAWEVYEVLIRIQIFDDYYIDTAIDLFLGSLGGITAFIVGNQMRKELL